MMAVKSLVKASTQLLFAAFSLPAACGPTPEVAALAGYRPGALLSEPVFETASCGAPSGSRRICNPSDTVRLTFFDDALFQTRLQVSRPAIDPGALWAGEWEARAIQLLGPPDSVLSGIDSTYHDPPRHHLHALWRAAGRGWSSDLWIFAASRTQPESLVQWQVQCSESVACGGAGAPGNVSGSTPAEGATDAATTRNAAPGIGTPDGNAATSSPTGVTSSPTGVTSSPTGTDSSPPAGAAGERRVVFLGTSLTAGYGLSEGEEQAYPALIQDRIEAAGLPFRVDNQGVSGETSAGGLRRIDWLLREPIDVLVIELGANDGLRGLDVGALRDNLDQVIERTLARYPGAAIVVLGLEAPPNMGPDYTAEFRAVYREVAAKHDAAHLPFLLDGVAGVPRLNQSDGIHPTPEGQRMMADLVWEVLEPVLLQQAGREAAPPEPAR